jgi:hypothetical protein
MLTNEQIRKLSRYFLNADPFLWGVLKSKNKKGRIKELQDSEYLSQYTKGSNPIYTRINRDLLLELGITGILEKIVVPRIRELFTPEDLRYFRDCWEQGQTPEMKYLQKNKLYGKNIFAREIREGFGDERVTGYKDSAFIFVQIETQFNLVQRWTVFGGLWVEEIEPSLG